MAQFGQAQKGYFDVNDLTSALTVVDPSLMPDAASTQAQQIMSFWDGNADGHVTLQEVIAYIQKGGCVGGQQLNGATSSTAPTSSA